MQLLASATMLAYAQTKSYPIVDTGQTLCYDAEDAIEAPKRGAAFYGQDAQHWGNAPSYTDLGNGCIKDRVTGLIWEKGYRIMGLDEALAAAKTCRTGGHSDWRLPNIKEVYSLALFSGVDASSRDMSSIPSGAKPFIDTKYFDFKYAAHGTRPIDSQMLSSTRYVSTTMNADATVFGFNLADGRIKGYPIIEKRQREPKQFIVRFVRGKQYGRNEFVKKKNGTITDKATGLTWTSLDSKRALNWQDALQLVQTMNKKKYCGYSDWRLPNAKELHSIVDYTRSPETSQSASIDKLFHCTEITNEAGKPDYPFYWTSTTHLGPRKRGARNAVYIAFGRALGNMPARGGRGGQRGTSSGRNWVDAHGAGCQRSAPKQGDESEFADGRGPQGDVVRIKNYVRLVRGGNK